MIPEMQRRCARASGVTLRHAILVIAALGFGLAPSWISGRILLAGSELAPPVARTEPDNPLAAGSRLYARLETQVSTTASHLHDKVTARVARETVSERGVVIPLGAQILGQIETVIPSSSPTDRARMRLKFDQLELPGQQALSISAHLVEIENARESVLSDGTIQGVLASELPLSHLEDAIAKLGTSGDDLHKAQEKTLGKSDTSIDYAPGADLVLVLDKPLKLETTFPPAVPDKLDKSVSGAVAKLLADAPQRVSGKDGKPGDPLNLVVIGNADEIRAAFKDAGWSEASKKTSKSIWGTVRAVAGDKGYGAAPVSDLYLYNRSEDFAFEKMLNTFLKRHHLRLWRSPEKTPEGREIWLGAGTHDAGLDVRPGVMSHAIDPNLDDERAQVSADLALSGHLAAESLVTRANSLTQGLTATGATWKTDGRLLVLELKPQ